MGSAGLRHLGHAFHLRRSDHRTHLCLFAHLPGGLAQRAIQQGRVAKDATVVVGRWRDARVEPQRACGTIDSSQQCVSVDHCVDGEAQNRQTDSGRRRQLRRLLRSVLHRANVGSVG